MHKKLNEYQLNCFAHRVHILLLVIDRYVKKMRENEVMLYSR